MSVKFFYINKRGSVSLFVVIFFSLLATVMVAGFVRVAIKDQQATLARNLSQSAYDASQAGIEDAKRVITEKDACGSLSSTKCDNLRTKINSTSCNEANSLLKNPSTPSTNEIRVENANYSYNQAYTCVTIENNTQDFLGSLNADSTKIIPLIGESTFDKIKLEWFTKLNSGGNTVTFPNYLIYNPVSIDTATPPFLAVRLIQSPDNISSLNFLNSNTYFSRIFLRPNTSGSNALNFTSDAPESIKPIPYDATCDPSFASGYACSINLNLPATQNNSLIELKSIYKNTDYRVTLYSGNNAVKFKGVQTKIDSTGRANDIFRRVETRLETTSIEAYPTSAIEVEGNFCKNFSLTTVASNPYSDCTP